MAKEMESQKTGAATDREMFDELVRLHTEAAGKSLSSILKTDIEIYDPEVTEMTVREVEYSILEPAIFVRSCLTSNVAGNTVLILRQRDMQAFLNELMGIDDLPDPDFEFDEVAMSAATELMNQMVQAAVGAMAQYLGDTMEASECKLSLSDGRQNLAPVIGEAPDSKTTVVHYRIRIKDMVESEFLECISATAKDSIFQEIEAKKEEDTRAIEEAKKMEAELIVGSAGGIGVPTRQNGFAGGNGIIPGGNTGMASPAGTSRSAANGPAAADSWTSGQARQGISENLGLIMDVPLNVSVEIGKTRRRLKDVLNFNNGTVVELDKQADAPVDIIVNGQLIARGEVVVIDDNFGVRISEIINTRSIIGNGE